VSVRFEQRDLTGYAEKGRFDFITSFDAVHDQKNPQALICSLHGALRPCGIYLMQMRYPAPIACRFRWGREARASERCGDGRRQRRCFGRQAFAPSSCMCCRMIL
jgi:hypothetical protein